MDRSEPAAVASAARHATALEALASIHRRFLASHRLPPTTTILRSDEDDLVARATTAPTSLESTMSDLDKRVRLEGLKRRRMALQAAVCERRALLAQRATSLRVDLVAQRSRQREWSRRPYLRYLLAARDVSTSSSSTTSSLRASSCTRKRRRAVDFVESSVLFNDLAAQDEQGSRTDRREKGTAAHRQIAAAVAESNPLLSSSNRPPPPPNDREEEADVVLTETRRLRLLRRISSSYLLLSGISVALQDKGRVLALQFDSNGGESSRDAAEDDHNDDALPKSCCAFFHLVVPAPDAANRSFENGRRDRQERRGSSSSSSTPGPKEASVVHYLRLQSHTFPRPLAVRVTSLLGLVRVGPLKGNTGRDEDADDDNDNTNESSAFLTDFGRRVGSVRRHLVAFCARESFIAQLIAMYERSQKKASRNRQALSSLVDAVALEHGLDAHQASRRQPSRLENGESDEAMSDSSATDLQGVNDDGSDDDYGGDDDDDDHDNDDDDDDDDDDDQTQTTTATAVAEDVTGSKARGRYHHVNRIDVNAEQVKFRLNCSFGSSTVAPQPPKLVVTVAWPQQQPLLRPLRVSIAYHNCRSNQILVRDTIHAVREIRRRRRQRSSNEVSHRDDRDATSAAMAISSDEEEEEGFDESSPRHPTVRTDPYLRVLQPAACVAFGDLPVRSAVHQLVSTMRELVEDVATSA